MFDSLEDNQSQRSASVEDIFANADHPGTPLPPSPLKPVVPVPASAVPAPTPQVMTVSSGGAGKKVAIAVVVVLLLGGVAGAYWWFSRAPLPEPEVPQIPVVTPNEPVAPSPDDATTLPPPEQAAGPADSDSDGLTDEEEASLGTNSQNIDSDNDGLFDRDEVRVYKTDPLNPDSDGDTFSDGTEVLNGYNPNGAGKLLELPQ